MLALFWATLFWDNERRRLRAGLRIGLHLLALGALLYLVAVFGSALPPLALGPIAFGGVITITALCARFVDRRPLVDLGLRVDAARAIDLGAGVAVGASAVAIVALAESLLGVADYGAVAIDSSRSLHALFVAVFFVGVGIQEELVFRGYQLVNLTEGLAGPRLSPPRAAAMATVVAAAAFGLAHIGNDGASMLATLQVAVAGGTLLAVGFLLTGDLAYSIGLHFAWNFTQCLLGMPVSGFVLSSAALVTRAPHGSEWLTGGAFGPEASVVGLGAMLVGTAASIGYVRARYGSLALRLRVEITPAALPSTSSEPPSGDC